MADNVKMWMPVKIGDTLADTASLTPLEFGAYMRIVMQQWRRGHLRPETLQTIAGVKDADAWSIAYASLEHLLSIDEAGLVFSPEYETEKDRAERKRIVFNERAKKAAAARWKSHREHKAKGEEKGIKNDASSNAQAVLEECPSPSELSTTTSPFSPPPSPPHPPTPAPGTGGGVSGEYSEGMEKPARKPVERSATHQTSVPITKVQSSARQPYSASAMGGLHYDLITQKRIETIKSLIFAWWIELNGISCPWGDRDQKALERFAVEHQGVGESEMRECLKHRKVSIEAGEYSPTLLPRKWINHALLFLHHPIGRNNRRLRVM